MGEEELVVEEEEDVELDEAEEDVRDVVDDDPDDPRLDSEDLEAILRVYVRSDVPFVTGQLPHSPLFLLPLTSPNDVLPAEGLLRPWCHGSLCRRPNVIRRHRRLRRRRRTPHLSLPRHFLHLLQIGAEVIVHNVDGVLASLGLVIVRRAAPSVESVTVTAVAAAASAAAAAGLVLAVLGAAAALAGTAARRLGGLFTWQVVCWSWT